MELVKWKWNKMEMNDELMKKWKNNEISNGCSIELNKRIKMDYSRCLISIKVFNLQFTKVTID
jgi:hypothetical protein